MTLPAAQPGEALHLSIITACYNSTRYIERTYASLLAQTDARFCWIVVDDCSTDETSALLRRFAAEAPFQVVALRLKQNGGQTIAQAVGVAQVSTPYACFLDHDDEFLPGAVQRILADLPAVEREGCVGLAYRSQDENGKLLALSIPERTASHSKILNYYRNGEDRLFIFATARLQQVYTLDYARRNHMTGPMHTMSSAHKPFLFTTQEPLKIYHTDVPEAQTRNFSVTPQLVHSYASMLSQFDRWYWFRIDYHLRLMLHMMRFAGVALGSRRAGIALLERSWLRLAAWTLLPACWALDHTLWPRPRRRERSIPDPVLVERLDER